MLNLFSTNCHFLSHILYHHWVNYFVRLNDDSVSHAGCDVIAVLNEVIYMRHFRSFHVIQWEEEALCHKRLLLLNSGLSCLK